MRIRSVKTGCLSTGRKSSLCAGILICSAILQLACGKPFNVKPKTDLPSANYDATASSGPVVVGARLISDESLLYETFDANLLLAGIVPIRVSISNPGGEKVDLSRARFQIRTAEGRTFNSSSARSAFERMISYYEITTYNKAGYRESLNDFMGHGLEISKPLESKETREGILFFIIPSQTWPQKLDFVLKINRIDKSSIELNLK